MIYVFEVQYKTPIIVTFSKRLSEYDIYRKYRRIKLQFIVLISYIAYIFSNKTICVSLV